MASHLSRPISFFKWANHRILVILALPMMISNITTPLLGMVDTAVVGNMGNVTYLAGAAIGGTVVTQLYWLCGFIRMSATGLSAQAKGQQDTQRANRVLHQSAWIGLMLGILFVVLQTPLIQLGLIFADASPELTQSINHYAQVRIWGAPAVLASLGLVGWLLGQQQMRTVLFIQIAGNLLNIVLDLLFVFVFDWQLEGVALASVLAEYSILGCSIFSVGRQLKRMGVSVTIVPSTEWFRAAQLKPLLSLNSAMLIRNIALQLCLAFVVYQGARLGEDIAAVNAILMNFLILTALGLDGIAYAAEALVGQSKGQGSQHGIVQQTKIALLWSSLVALVTSVVFILLAPWIIAHMTNLMPVRQLAEQYYVYIVLLPLIGHWCFLFDGIFIGLSNGKWMRNTMLFSALAVFFPTWFLLQQKENHSLWIALLAFIAARGVTLGGYFYHLASQKKLLD